MMVGQQSVCRICLDSGCPCWTTILHNKPPAAAFGAFAGSQLKPKAAKSKPAAPKTKPAAPKPKPKPAAEEGRSEGVAKIKRAKNAYMFFVEANRAKVKGG